MFNGKRMERFSNIQSAAMRKLALLNAAGRIEDLRVPPGNRLEALRGKRQGRWGVRINDQWRICFRFETGDAFDVEIVDYH
jgi:proteic killer suppression protein